MSTAENIELRYLLHIQVMIHFEGSDNIKKDMITGAACATA
jgi:hypothetical protein